MIGVIGLLQMLLEMRVMDSDWCQVTSPRAFMVIDDKGGEEHGLKLKKKRRREENLSSECVCFSRTGLTGLLTGLTGHHFCTLKL